MKRLLVASSLGLMLGATGCTSRNAAPEPKSAGPSAATTVPASGGSRSLPDASRPDASATAMQPDAGKPTIKPDAGMSATMQRTDAACAPLTDAIAVEGQLGMGLSEMPQIVEDPEAVYDRTITPEAKKFYEGRPPTTAFEGPTDRGTRGVLSFALDPSFVPEDLIGKKVRLRGQYRFLGCDQPGGPQISAEPAKLSITTLRDSAGELLVVAAASTPTAAGGVTSFIPELAPELGISWIADASCGQPALELKVQKTGEKIAAKERQRRDFELDGKTYVFATEAVRAPQTEQYCGFATWVVYRKGFFKPVP